MRSRRRNCFSLVFVVLVGVLLVLLYPRRHQHFVADQEPSCSFFSLLVFVAHAFEPPLLPPPNNNNKRLLPSSQKKKLPFVVGLVTSAFTTSSTRTRRNGTSNGNDNDDKQRSNPRSIKGREREPELLQEDDNDNKKNDNENDNVSGGFLSPSLPRRLLNDNNTEDTNDLLLIEEDDEGFGAWVQGLGQWPLIPDPPPPSSSSAKLLKDDARPNNNPLSKLLDLEALWNSLQQQKEPMPPEPFSSAPPPVDLSSPPGSMATTTEATTPTSPKEQDSSLLEGLYKLLAVERILQAGGLIRLFEKDVSTSTTMSSNVSSSTTTIRIDENENASLPAAAEAPALMRTTGITTTTPQPQNTTMFKQAIVQLESFVNDASSLLLSSPTSILDFIGQATQVLQEIASSQNRTLWLQAVNNLQLQGGAEGREEAERRVKEALAFSANLVSVADSVLRQGYVATTRTTTKLINQTLLTAAPPSLALPLPSLPTKTIAPALSTSRALFADFASVHELSTYSPPLVKAADMGTLAGAIYEQTVPRTHGLRHTIVAQGVTSNVKWMITDSIDSMASFVDSTSANRRDDNNSTSFVPTNAANATTTATTMEPFMVRTITIRGFDASDDTVDREELLVRVCTATPEPIQTKSGGVVELHTGMWSMAQEIYQDVKQYVTWTAPDHKIVLTGHSVGGSLSILLLLWMTLDFGSEFVNSKVLRVYTYGSPPVVRRRSLPKPHEAGSLNTSDRRRDSSSYRCDVLEAFELPSSLVEGYVQPWDPIVRLFSEIDPFYPLLGDVGADGVTPWASGPPRTLRPITKAIMEAWEGWPRFRDSLGGTGNQTYRSVGVQNILVPEPTRYLADRFVGVNIPVPPVASVLRISSQELLPALQLVFPLDVFEISFVPQAIRSFVHHFYPAYGFPMIDYVKRLETPTAAKSSLSSLASSSVPSTKSTQPVNVTVDSAKTVAINGERPRSPKISSDLISDLGRAAQWLQRKESK